MITPRQWDGLIAATGLAAEFEQLSQKLGLNLGLEGDRFKARAGITEMLNPWFAARRVDDFARSLNESGITWSVFRSFAQTVAEDPDCSSINFSAFNRFRLEG